MVTATADRKVEFGQRLRALRENRSLSAAALAERLSTKAEPFTTQAVTAWERGEWAPRHRGIVVRLEKVLGAEGELLPILGYAVSDESLGERISALENRLDGVERLLQEQGRRRAKGSPGQ